jgi:hypothetical protein
MFGSVNNAEWEEINAGLPDIRPVVDRRSNWPYLEWIGPDKLDFQTVGRLRISGACFWDACENIRGARFALAQAIGVREFFFNYGDPEQTDKGNRALGYFYSQLYGDYVPLLLYSGIEHALNGLLSLFDVDVSIGKGKYLLRRVIDGFRQQRNDHALSLHF